MFFRKKSTDVVMDELTAAMNKHFMNDYARL